MLSHGVENAGSVARHKTALIVEGGAMRGAWAAGVLAYLQECGRRQYDLVYAASSGACSAAYFVADMWEPGLAIWRELACNVVRKSNFLRRKPIIDLAYLVDYVIRKRVPLSVELLQKMPTRFFIVLTDCYTGEPVYFHACDDRVFAALRATSSMPLATRGFDYVDGQPFADGGVSDPIPLQRAIQDGATDITVVLTHNPAFPSQADPALDGKTGLPGFSRGGRSLDRAAKCELQRRPRLDETAAGGSPDPGVSSVPAAAGGFLLRRAETNRRRPDPGPRRGVTANGGREGETGGRFTSRLEHFK